ncbi:AraC family transcriptional regulator [Brucella tritici]|uniref:AraC family transcriptional regulator n=1 Tax=Brucella tritici TaxID=94626 RepID=A0A7X6JE10_9HYPH|nr:AraC family transcriptional regulator [Brucella tritici]KAB2662675.1 AraC family transcriptional regulator [Brucella tritici]NKW11070.1 AraC family transcriptional regulator [Brucella tritici]
MYYDPLSQLLDLIEASATMSVGLEACGRWAIDVPPVRALKCNIIRQGSCFLEVQGERLMLAAGDCFLIGPDLPFVIGSDLNCLPIPAGEVFSQKAYKNHAKLDGGAGSEFLCHSGRMDLPLNSELLREILPSIVVIRAESIVAERLHWLTGRLEEELAGDVPGGAAIAIPIMQMIFIELIRSLPVMTERSWLSALSDPRIGGALMAIHWDPGHNWRLDELAGISHLSRSQFSARFRAAVGHSPMEYILRWRMMQAHKLLARPNMTIASVAAQLGYGSESAFIYAFRRILGTTPRRRQQQIRSSENP